jgi:long chain fatty acid CoA FadD26
LFSDGSGPICDALSRWSRDQGDETAFTFVDYLTESSGAPSSYTWRELDQRVLETAAHLQSLAGPGDRCAILLPNSLDYVVAFLACLRAGVVAVPLFPPSHAGKGDRLTSVLTDSRPVVLLTSAAGAAEVKSYVADHASANPALAGVSVVETDRTDLAGGAGWRRPVIERDTLAYLQYTSGSTSSPAGVMLTHGNVVANTEQLFAAFDVKRTASWLPLFHDMGLAVGVLIPVMAGVPCTLLEPMAFLQRPVRWLRALGAGPGTFSAAPNFAFDYCVRRVREADRESLRLENVEAVVNGSEPVRLDTIERFAEAFAASGFRPQAHRPSFGLAEATVFVGTTPAGEVPSAVTLDRARLTLGRAVPVEPAGDGVRLVACGAAVGQHLVPVDPETGVPRDDGVVGELWLHGPNIGVGYWGNVRPETFGATITDPTGELPSGPWLRTGDLGVILDGSLYITGRLKDMVIIDGRNHYPQDIEATVYAVEPGIRSGYVAAFGVDTPDGEGLVVVAGGSSDDPAAMRRAIRRAVSEEHGISLHDFALVPSGSVPRTTSGKISRSACRKLYLAGELTRAAG